MSFGKIKNTLLYAGFEKEEYVKIEPTILLKNTKNVSLYSFLMMFYFLFITVMSVFLATNKQSIIYMMGYIVTVLLGVLYLVAKNMSKNTTKWWIHITLNYTFMILLYAEAILLTCFSPARVDASTTFLVELIVLPMLLMDKPIRMIVFQFITMVVYLVSINIYKIPEIAALETRNNWLYLVISIIIIVFVTTMRMREDVLKQRSIELEVMTKINKELEMTQKELEKAREVAEEANQAKTSFLLNMSHDIRTPMNAIVGYSRLIRKGLSDPDMIHYQEEMEKASELLLSLINNVLDMAKIENGNVELSEDNNEAGDIISSIISVFSVLAEKKNIEFLHSVEVEHPYIVCDKTKLQNIFTNLISNAIKYTNDGGKISIITKEYPSDKDGYAIYQTVVADNGIGMSKEFIPTLFETFTREKNTTAAKVGGTGLGMSIVKKYVELMNGTIDVESEVGKGSKFTVTLMHKIVDKSELEAGKSSLNLQDEALKLTGKRVLLAEDNEINAEITVEILNDLNMSVDCVEDGLLCVKKLMDMPENSYDVVLMDIQMPNMNGYTASQAIRRLDNPHKASIPIIAFTADAFEEDRQKALDSGMNDYLSKPIEIEQVIMTLVEILDKE